MSRYTKMVAAVAAAVAGIAFGAGFAVADSVRAAPAYRTPNSCIRALDQASEGFSRAVDVVGSGLDMVAVDSFSAWVDATTPGLRADSTACREMAR